MASVVRVATAAAATAGDGGGGAPTDWVEQHLTAEDIAYEEDIIRNPGALSNWWFYIDYKIDAPPRVRYLLFERALKVMPRSYKLWFRYLTERAANTRRACIADAAYTRTNDAFDRALVHMSKMPRIWIEYLTFLVPQKRYTHTRHAFDRALRALPVRQHHKIWPLYLEFVATVPVVETAVRVMRRYIKIDERYVEELIAYLLKHQRFDDAAQRLAACLDDVTFVSASGKSRHEMWGQLLDIITKNPAAIRGMDVDEVVRGGLRRYPHEAGRLWAALADYYIRSGHFEKARDVYEESMDSVATVRDFTLVFDAYARFEETMLTTLMGALDDGDSTAYDDDVDEHMVDIDLRMARLEELTARRPLLVNNVLLRQNPHHVGEWMKRVKLFKHDAHTMLRTYSDAVSTIDPAQATGHPGTLWVAFARFYEDHCDIGSARDVLDRAVLVAFESVDDLASVWCHYVEMELRHRYYERALALCRRACTVPANHQSNGGWMGGGGWPVQQRVYKSTRLWSLYADLEENLGSLDSTKRVYDQMITIGVVSPLIVLRYVRLLEEHKYYEDSFRVFEKTMPLFDYPHVFALWCAYLIKFTDRYRGTKLERGRDLYEQAIRGAPPERLRVLYVLYADYEEEYGLARRAVDIYRRACDAVPRHEKLGVYIVYITRVGHLFGLPKTRDVYEQAIRALPNDCMKPVCLRYATLERRLGEIDRARAIYVYVSQFCEPQAHADMWGVWRAFEVAHGNTETFKDMLRIRRSVQQKFAFEALTVSPLAAITAGTATTGAAGAMGMMKSAGAGAGAGVVVQSSAAAGADPMAALESQQEQQQQQQQQVCGLWSWWCVCVCVYEKERGYARLPVRCC